MVERIKSLCASRGISLNDLERSCDGLSVNTIYRWDNAPPSVWKVKAVADYFGVSVDYLLGRETSISASDADLLRKYHPVTCSKPRNPAICGVFLISQQHKI